MSDSSTIRENTGKAKSEMRKEHADNVWIFWVEGCRLKGTGYRLKVEGCRLKGTGYRLKVAGCGLKA
jgi:hypothetical protein